MKIYLPENEFKDFLHLNQSDEKITKNACSFYAPVNNLSYNTGIVIPEEDIKKVIVSQKGRGLFFPDKGGKLDEGVKAIYKYISDNKEYYKWRTPTVVRFKKTEKQVNKLLEKGYSFIVGFGVSRDFYDDMKDGKLETYKDYKKYKGKYFRHAVNIVQQDGKGYILDSFSYGSKNIPLYVECDLEEFKTDLMHYYIYMFV